MARLVIPEQEQDGGRGKLLNATGSGEPWLEPGEYEPGVNQDRHSDTFRGGIKSGREQEMDSLEGSPR